MRIYFPPDANTLLWITDHCLRTYDRINVIVAGKAALAAMADHASRRRHIATRHRDLEMGRQRNRRHRAGCRDGLCRRRSDVSQQYATEPVRCRRRSDCLVSSVGTSPRRPSPHRLGAAVSLPAHRQIPMPASQCAAASLDGQPLRRGLFAGDNDVDPVIGPQAMIGDPEQRVGVRRQINADDVGLLVGDESTKPGSWWLKPLWSWRQTWRSADSSARRSGVARAGCAKPSAISHAG